VLLESRLSEPSGLDRQDGKRSDGLTLIPWQGGRSLVWDVTVVSLLAASYVDRAATDAGTAANMAASRKAEKYSALSSMYIHVAVENLGALSSSTLHFLLELGRQIYSQSGDGRESWY